MATLFPRFLSFRGCHTQAKTLDELMKRTREAIKVCLGSSNEGMLATKFVGIQKLAV